MNSKPKIAIIHDSFLYRGGGERLVTLMAKVLDADLISGFFSEGSFDPRELGFTGRMISLGKPVFAKGLRHMILKWRFFARAGVLREYDIVIFSGDCLGALRHVRKDAKAYYYCHTPPRYLYDFRERYLAKMPFFVRPFFRAIFAYFAHVYERNLSRFTRIVTNSRNVENRLRSYTGYDSTVIYPPIDTTFFVPADISKTPGNYPPTPLGRGTLEEELTMAAHQPSPIQLSTHPTIHPSNYFFSWARLSPPKRVGLIVDAFLGMPEKNLILSYGKNDPLKGEILTKITGAKNITAIEAPDDAKLLSLIQNATATLYIPVDEDFGMSPVESMACGVPVIGVREGGLLETVVDTVTGKLITLENHEEGIEALRNTIENTSPDKWRSMREASLSRAEDFSLEKFGENLQSLLSLT